MTTYQHFLPSVHSAPGPTASSENGRLRRSTRVQAAERQLPREGDTLLPAARAANGEPTLKEQLVSFVIYPDALLLDLAGPLQVFEIANETRAVRGLAYRIAVGSKMGGLVRTSSGLEVMTVALDTLSPSDTVVVVGGLGAQAAANDPVLYGWMANQAALARRVCSVCTGAFVLAAAGLLERRRAATHWAWCSLLKDQFPSIMVMPDAIHVQDGQVWTSAGATAGIDLALALVEADCGRREAMRIARELVVFLKRSGGQTQYSVPLRLQADDDGSFDGLHDWIQAHLAEDLRVETLASAAGMSPRTFARLYTARTGRTPAKMVESLRMEAARRALEDTRFSIKEIALKCGFLEEERMRRCFRRSLGVNPQNYRDRFC